MAALIVTNLEAQFRDVRDFLQAKKIKREPVRAVVDRASSTTCSFSSERDYRDLRGELKRNRDFGRASEQLDKLELAYVRRYGAAFPTPRSLVQNPDRSLAAMFGKLTIRAYPDSIAWLLGGTAGHYETGIKPMLLEAIRMKAAVRR